MPTHSRSYKSPARPHDAHPDAVSALRRAGALERRVEDVLARWELTWAQFDTLLCLRSMTSEDEPTRIETVEEDGYAMQVVQNRGEPLGVRDAIQGLGEGAFERMEKLVEKGYLKKTDHPFDGRKKVLELTDDGQQVLHQALLALEESERVADPVGIVET